MKLCVFCSASNNIADDYKRMAFRLGGLIAQTGNTLVYGGAKGGLMSCVAKGAGERKGEIVGIVAESIVKMGRLSDLPTRRIVVKNLSERKWKMKEEADFFIVLPGGYGTLDEMFDVVASGTVGEHKKPLIVVNYKGFFDFMEKEFEWMKKEKCIPEQENYHICFVDSVDECMNQIIKYKSKQ